MKKKPYLMITQFHGIDGNCMTVNQATKSCVLTTVQEWVRLFRETAEALLYVHKKRIAA